MLFSIRGPAMHLRCFQMRCYSAAPPRIAYPLLRFALLLSSVASCFVASPFLCFASRRMASRRYALATLFSAFPLHRVSLLCESFADRVESLLFQCVSYLALQFRCTSQRLQSQQCQSYSEPGQSYSEHGESISLRFRTFPLRCYSHQSFSVATL